MIAQAYYENPHDMIVRIFRSDQPYAIADLPIMAATTRGADEALRKMRLIRRSRWTAISGGRECYVSFAGMADKHGRKKEGKK
jgi:hypothetical protein